MIAHVNGEVLAPAKLVKDTEVVAVLGSLAHGGSLHNGIRQDREMESLESDIDRIIGKSANLLMPELRLSVGGELLEMWDHVLDDFLSARSTQGKCVSVCWPPLAANCMCLPVIGCR